MGVDIKLLGVFKEVFGRSHVSLPVEAPKRLKDIMVEIVRTSPELKRVLIDPELQDPRPNAIILVNGREVSVLGGLEAEVKDGDKIVLIPVTHGG